MASITKRLRKDGTPRFSVRIRRKGREPVFATFDRLTDAKRWAKQTEADLHSRRYFPVREAERRTLGELIDRYLQEALPDLNATDQSTRPARLGFWNKKLGRRFLCEVTPSAIRRCREELRAGGGPWGRPVGAGTVNRYLTILAAIFTFAQRDLEWIDHNPVQKVRRDREPQGRTRFLADVERERLLAACKASPERFLYPAVVTSIASGMRQGETLSLTWSQIDLERGLVRLEHTKNGERRVVPLKGHALDEMRKLKRTRRLDTDLIFARQDGRKPKVIRRHWLQALADAELRDFRWHDLRHCAGSYAAMQGWSELEIAALLGHKTTRMVRRYSHLSQEHLEERTERLVDSVFG